MTASDVVWPAAGEPAYPPIETFADLWAQIIDPDVPTSVMNTSPNVQNFCSGFAPMGHKLAMPTPGEIDPDTDPLNATSYSIFTPQRMTGAPPAAR
jgi:hypothetical protein